MNLLRESVILDRLFLRDRATVDGRSVIAQLWSVLWTHGLVCILERPDAPSIKVRLIPLKAEVESRLSTRPRIVSLLLRGRRRGRSRARPPTNPAAVQIRTVPRLALPARRRRVKCAFPLSRLAALTGLALDRDHAEVFVFPACIARPVEARTGDSAGCCSQLWQCMRPTRCACVF